MTSSDSFAIRGRLLFGTHLDAGTVIVDKGTIAHISRHLLRNGDLPGHVIDADIVSPGMIDLQVNGAFGVEVGPNATDLDAISKGLLATGVTAWLPTVVTAPADFYPPVFAAWNDIDPTAGAVPLGLHLEGPFLSPEKKGAHRLECIEAASDELFASWLDQKSIALVTLAPEREGGTQRIRQLVERGILVSLGHTNATYEAFVAGVDAGARKATHLFNAMTAIHHRAPGAMVATMVDDRVTAGLIPDGVHSHPATVRLALRSKGVDGIVIVSDMMSACGLGPGVYTLSSLHPLHEDRDRRRGIRPPRRRHPGRIHSDHGPGDAESGRVVRGDAGRGAPHGDGRAGPIARRRLAWAPRGGRTRRHHAVGQHPAGRRHHRQWRECPAIWHRIVRNLTLNLVDSGRKHCAFSFICAPILENS
jgi:N-acetylglucosamine-6-phosphate deacetylase